MEEKRKLTRREFLQVSVLATAAAALAACKRNDVAPSSAALDKISTQPKEVSEELTALLKGVDWSTIASDPDLLVTQIGETLPSVDTNIDTLEIHLLNEALHQLNNLIQTPKENLNREQKILSSLITLRNYSGILLAQKNYAKFVEVSHIFHQLAASISQGSNDSTGLAQLDKDMDLMMQFCINQQEGELALARYTLQTVETNLIPAVVDSFSLDTGAWRMHARNNNLEPLFDRSPTRYQQAAILYQSYINNLERFSKIWTQIATANGYSQLEPENKPSINDWYDFLDRHPLAYEQFVDSLSIELGSVQPHFNQGDATDALALNRFVRLSLEGQVVNLSEALKKKDDRIEAITAALMGVFQMFFDANAYDLIDPLVNNPLTVQKIQQMIDLDMIEDQEVAKFFKTVNPDLLKQKIDEVSQDQNKHRWYSLMAYARMIAKNFIDQHEAQMVINKPKDIYANITFLDSEGKTQNRKHLIWSITNPMGCSPLIMFPSVLANPSSKGVYLGPSGYLTEPDNSVQNISITFGDGKGVSSANLSSKARLLGVMQVKASGSSEIELALLAEVNEKIVRIEPNLIGGNQRAVKQLPGVPEIRSVSTKITEFLNSVDLVSNKMVQEWRTKLILEGDQAFTITDHIRNGDITVGYRSVEQIFKTLLNRFFNSIIKSDNAIREHYMNLYDQAKAWSGWGLVYPREAEDISLLTEPISAQPPQLYYVTFTKDGGVLRNKWQRGEISPAPEMVLDTPLQCISSPDIDKITTSLFQGEGLEVVVDKTLRGDNEYVYIIPVIETNNTVRFLAAKRDDVKIQYHSTDLKQSEKDLQTLLLGLGLDAAVQLGLLQKIFGLPGKILQAFFKKESPLSPSQAILMIRLLEIYNALQP